MYIIYSARRQYSDFIISSVKARQASSSMQRQRCDDASDATQWNRVRMGLQLILERLQLYHYR